MKETKFTKGPWFLGEQNSHCGISITPHGNQIIATVYLGMVTSRAKRGDEHFSLPENANAVANANLIAAAPELYEALVTASTLYQIIIGMGRTEYKELLDHANSVLSKARGE